MGCLEEEEEKNIYEDTHYLHTIYTYDEPEINTTYDCYYDI
jgi:hypothetical protein